MKNPFLIGERLYARPPERDDATVVQAWLNDPDVRRFLRLYRPIDLQAEVDYIDKTRSDQTAIGLLIALKEDDRPIGVCSLRDIDSKNRKAEFGIGIGDKACWGQGLGSEATQLMIDYGFATLNLNRVFLHVHAYNDRAVCCYEKLGFQREGVLRQEHFCDGRYWDTIVMSMLREEWDWLRK
ncbi:MAG: GNAT family N-acetyltransferase [Planctomycetes bacterium]|nr:GNAT family N-acetyltransferase [Planctomycetota bacterium]